MSLKKLRSLLELMSANDVSEMEISEGDTVIRIKRGTSVVSGGMMAAGVMGAGGAAMEHPTLVSIVPQAGPPGVGAGGAAAGGAVAEGTAPGGGQAAGGGSNSAQGANGEADADFAEFVSPMVGTFYRAPSPEAGPYVTEGDKVSEETVLCIIEAMKVMNEIKAELRGEVVEVLVENGEAVEFGQPLFLLKKSG